MNMTHAIAAAGILPLALAAIHIPGIWQLVFPNWEKETAGMSLVNRKALTTVLIALTLSLLIFAVTSLLYAEAMASAEGLAAGITIAYSLFWLWRALWQMFYFVPSKLALTRTGHDRRLLRLHYSLIVIFIALFTIYLLPVALQLMH